MSMSWIWNRFSLLPCWPMPTTVYSFFNTWSLSLSLLIQSPKQEKKRKRNQERQEKTRKANEVFLKSSSPSPLQEKTRKMTTLLKGPIKKSKEKEVSSQKTEPSKNLKLFAAIITISVLLAHAFNPRNAIVPREFSTVYIYIFCTHCLYILYSLFSTVYMFVFCFDF